MTIKQPLWYKWTEAKLDQVAWAPYAVALGILAITGWLLILAWTGHDVKTLLTAWLVYLVMP